MITKKARTWILSLSAVSLLAAGCGQAPKQAADGQKWDDAWLMIGSNIGIEAPESLTFSEQNDALAAEGLYYATWVTGDSVPYENSDGDVIDLYDAQLYFLTSEASKEESAAKDCEKWLAAAKENYEVSLESTIVCNGQTYTLLLYDCVSEDTPYDRGASAFGVCGTNAVCAEFTCVKDYTRELEPMLTDFLDGCHFREQ